MNRGRYAKNMGKKPSERNHGSNQTITAAVMKNDNRKWTKKKEANVKMIGYNNSKAQQNKRRDAPP